MPAAGYDTPPGRLEDDPVYRAHRERLGGRITRVTSRPTTLRDALRAPADGAGSSTDEPIRSTRRSSCSSSALLADAVARSAASTAPAGADAGRRRRRSDALSRYGFRLTEVGEGGRARLRAPGADARREARRTSCRRSPRWAPRSPSSTSTATAGRTSTSPTAGKARRTASIATAATARSRTSPSALGVADVNHAGHRRLDGRGLGRLRQRRLRGPVRLQVGPARAVPQRRRQGLHARHRARPACRRGSTPNTAVWLDYDRDGRLDLFLGGYCAETARPLASRRHEDDAGELRVREERRPQVPASATSATAGSRTSPSSVGLDSRRWALAAVAADLRGTGYPDLFVANDYGVSELFANEGGHVPRDRQATPASATRRRAA